MTTHETTLGDVSTPHAARSITLRSKGHHQGPVTRLISPNDLGELVKPFVFLDYFDAESSADFPFVAHPHSGIATHTTFLEGGVMYGDSTGAAGTLEAGSIEWIQAGNGVWHWGAPSPGASARGYQLWVALPPELELAPATSRYFEANLIDSDGTARILFGEYEALHSPISVPLQMTYLHVTLADGQSWTYTPAADHDIAWLAIHTGRLHTAGTVLQGEVAIFEEGNTPIALQAEGDTEFVIGSATRHPHPLVLGPSSVHTSADALRQARERISRLANTPIVQAARAR
jgi:redox-sensitive bicupin YhaK (pirin superfamily)